MKFLLKKSLSRQTLCNKRMTIDDNFPLHVLKFCSNECLSNCNSIQYNVKNKFIKAFNT